MTTAPPAPAGLPTPAAAPTTPATTPAPAPAPAPAAKPVDPLARLGQDPTLLLFTATWCTPGTLLAPALAAVEGAGIRVRTVDIDTWPQHAEQFRVIMLPTLVLVRGGAEKRRHVGAISERELLSFARRK